MGGPIDGFARSIGDGVSTVVGRAIDTVLAAGAAIVAAASQVLPGPLLPIAGLVLLLGFLWLVFLKR